MATLLGYEIHKAPLDTIDFEKTKVVNTINPHSFCLAKNDEVFRVALKTADVLVPDGIGIVWAERLLNANTIKKIAGYNVFMFLMQRANSQQHKVFFLGATEETLVKIRAKAALDFPNVEVFSYSPPFKEIFSEVDSRNMCDCVNAVKPDVLFVGMTAPKQETWVYHHKNNLQATTICSIGAVFDFYAGNIKRSSPFWINLGLEWLPRFFKEPRRLARRNLVSTPLFIFEVLKAKIWSRTHESI